MSQNIILYRNDRSLYKNKNLDHPVCITEIMPLQFYTFSMKKKVLHFKKLHISTDKEYVFVMIIWCNKHAIQQSRDVSSLCDCMQCYVHKAFYKGCVC